MSEEIKARLDTLRTRMKAVNAGFRAGGLSQQEVAIGQENVDVLTDALAAIATLTADLTAARAEVERLREALRVFANIPHEEARFELHGEHAAAIPPSLANGAREGSL